MKNDNRLINIPVKTVVQVTALLLFIMFVSIILTYIVPGGEFGTLPDGTPDYTVYIRNDDYTGIPIWKGILAPVLVFFSSDGLTLLVLSIFLIVVAGAFQIMSDVGGVHSLIGSLSKKFSGHKYLLIIMMSLLFYSLGSFLGQFENMLTLLPITASLCVLLGYDSYTGFLCCIVSTGIGFATAITNPFTVVLASNIIDVSPVAKIWYRLIIFAVVFLILIGFIFLYIRKIEKDPRASLTCEGDRKLRAGQTKADYDESNEAHVRRVYTVFLLLAVAMVIGTALIDSVRSYSVVFLTVYFLIGGIAAGMSACHDRRKVFRSFKTGLISALPAILLVAVASSVKYVFVQGHVLPTIINKMNEITSGESPLKVALIVYVIVLVLEFFISSSTAKALLVMSMLSVASLGLSKTMLVLIYTFADGYTNLLFPTSPVLLIGLSMINVSYFTWVKKSAPFFVAITAAVVAFLAIGIEIGY